MTEQLSVNEGAIISQISGILQVRSEYVRNVLDLLKNGGTVPFIARYRKENTGSMNENDIRTVKDEYEKLFEIEEKRISTLKAIKLQESFQALDPKKQADIIDKITKAKNLREIEDLYTPYKPKRESKATKALKKGLGPLVEEIKSEPQGTEADRKKILEKYITKLDETTKKDFDDIIKKIKEAIAQETDPRKLEKLQENLKKAEEDKKKAKEREENVVKDEKDAINGALDILTEELSNIPEFKKYIREQAFERAIIVSKVAKEYEHLKLTQEKKAELEQQKLAQEEQRKKQEEEALKIQKMKEEEQNKIKKMTKAEKEKLEAEEKVRLLAEYEAKQKQQEDMKKLSVKERIRLQQEQLKKEEMERKKKEEERLLRKQQKEVGDILAETGKKAALGDEANVDPLVYEMYFEYEELAKNMPPHRILAINRGEREKVLEIGFKEPDDELIEWVKTQCIKKPTSLFLDEYMRAIRMAYKRIILSIEREIRSDMKEKAEAHAISVFAKNLGALLMQPPLKGRPIIAIDPGYAHGCKIAVIDEKGQYKDTSHLIKDNIIYPTPGPNQNIPQAKKDLINLMKTYNAYTIAIGNGTASREAESFVASSIKEIPKAQYCIVSEAGASVYSASDIAAEEFPNLSVEARGAISIARRLQDPLSELIKIDPKSIGVGLYQHDVNQANLKKQLDAVIEDCVNHVGVLVNSASYKLLEYVSGLSKNLARTIYDYTKKQPLKSREELKKVPGIGAKTFEQCAGFLKILDGLNPLDATTIHPESYWIVEGILKFIKEDPSILTDPSRKSVLDTKIRQIKPKELIEFLGKDVGLVTLKDIVIALLRPGRDPRDDLPPPILKKDILHAKDLKPGMVLKGTVRNVVDFGAFVDIGLHDDGLVHISEMKRLDNKSGFIDDPTEAVSVGSIIDVRVLKVEIRNVSKGGKEEEKTKISLSMYLDENEKGKKPEGGVPKQQSYDQGKTPSAGTYNRPRRDHDMVSADPYSQSGSNIIQRGQFDKLVKGDFDKEKIDKVIEQFEKGTPGIQNRAENQARMLSKYLPIAKTALGGLIIIATKRYIKDANKTLQEFMTMPDEDAIEAYKKIYQIVKLGVKECLKNKTLAKTRQIDEAFNEAESEFLSVI